MSAYALPGIFPPFQVEHHVGISSAQHDHSSYHTLRVHHAGNCERVELVKQHLVDFDDGEVKIRVKEAKVDARQLIQSLALTTAVQSKKRVRRRVLSCIKEDVPNPQELAMQFELDVNFRGRQYTLVRSLYRMRQLMRELLDELGEDSKVRWAIPELPTLMEKGCQGGANQSFSLLTGLLSAYAPALERWLQKIFFLVAAEESPTLTHFLSEPICFPTALERVVSTRIFSDGKRSTSLESIEEEIADE